MTHRSVPDPEELLRHAEWMTAMAVSLVGDPARADDIVQGAWTAAVESPPRNPRALGGWLKTVVRNLSRQSQRQETRRRRREVSVARSEVEHRSADELVARAELQRAIVDAVLALDEPYRSTVILRFFEDRTPHQIAERDGLPVKTVWTRLNRALAQLRVQLTRDYEGAERWRAILLPLLPGPGVAASGATALAPTVTTPAAAGGSTSSLLTATGSTLMTSKLIISGTIAGLVAIGVAVGHYMGEESIPDHMVLVERSAYTSLESEQARLREALASAEAARDVERSRARELADEGERLRGEMQRQEAERVARAEEPATTLPVEFGKYADLEGVKNANWPEMADAVARMTELLYEATKLENAGEDVPTDFQANVRQENSKLVKYLGGVAGQIESNSPINGEYTHPVTLINLLGALLEREGLPLDDEQRERVAAHGEWYEIEYQRTQASYADVTPQQRKLLDEVALKRVTMRAIEEELTRDQREAVIEPWLYDRIEIDPRSPVQMLLGQVRPAKSDSPEALRREMPPILGQLFQISPETLAELAPVFDRYLETVEPLLTPIPPEEFLNFFTLDEAILAGEAFAALARDIHDHPGVEESTRQRIRQEPRWFVPRIRQ